MNIEWALWISWLAKGPLYYIGFIGLFCFYIILVYLKNQNRNPFYLVSLLHSNSLLRAWGLGVFWSGGAVINLFLKTLFHAPRPWWIDPYLSPLASSPSLQFGFPSGHAQSAFGLVLFVFWFGDDLGNTVKKTTTIKSKLIDLIWKRSLYLMALLWCLSVGWSRVVLHAHSWFQVICGWILGGLWMGILIFSLYPSLKKESSTAVEEETNIHTNFPSNLSKSLNWLTLGLLTVSMNYLVLHAFFPPFYPSTVYMRFAELGLILDSTSAWVPMHFFPLFFVFVWCGVGWGLLKRGLIS